MEQIELNFGASLKKVLEKKKISLSELSRGTQIPVSTLHSWITGIKPKSFEHLVKISLFLAISCDELLNKPIEKPCANLTNSKETMQFEIRVMQIK